MKAKERREKSNENKKAKKGSKITLRCTVVAFILIVEKGKKMKIKRKRKRRVKHGKTNARGPWKRRKEEQS